MSSASAASESNPPMSVANTYSLGWTVRHCLLIASPSQSEVERSDVRMQLKVQCTARLLFHRLRCGSKFLWIHPVAAATREKAEVTASIAVQRRAGVIT
jgi:hypothetical protein